MGYTHYFYTKPTLDAKQFKSFAKDVKKLLNGVDEVAFECDMVTKRPQVTNEVVRFNGKGDDGHETFYLARESKVSDWQRDKEMAFNFCKTACKPYDKYVVACLILAKGWFKDDIRFSSDGEIEELQEGLQIVQTLFKLNIELKKDDKGRINIFNKT